MKLTVKELFGKDVYKDIARIPSQDRGRIKEGKIYNIAVNGHCKQLIVRGADESCSGTIMLDELTRESLGNLQEATAYEFTITKVGWFGRVKWACNVADAGARIAAWIAVISALIGIVGLLLGVYSIWLAYCPPHP